MANTAQSVPQGTLDFKEQKSGESDLRMRGQRRSECVGSLYALLEGDASEAGTTFCARDRVKVNLRSVFGEGGG